MDPNAVPYVVVGVSDADLPFVAFVDDADAVLRFASCNDTECSSLTQGGSYGLEAGDPGHEDKGWLGFWPSLGWSTDGLPVIGLGPTGFGSESWASILGCSDPACSDYTETRVEEIYFMALDVAEDGTTRLVGGELGADSSVGADGVELVVCAEPTCAEGITRIDVDGWRQFGTPHRLGVMNDNPVLSYLMDFGSPGVGPRVGVIECLDPDCGSIISSEITDANDHGLAAHPDGPTAIIHNVVAPGSSQGPPATVGLSLKVWDQDFGDATTVELDNVTPGTLLGFGAQSVAVDPEGRAGAAWIRTTLSGAADDAPEEAVAWGGWDAVDLADVPPATLRDLEITAVEGVLLSDVFPNSAAEEAGLAFGDVITSLNNNPIGAAEDLDDALQAASPGDTVSVDYDRFGLTGTTEITLSAAFDELMVTRCAERGCSTGTTAVLDAAPPGTLALWASLTFDSNGIPVIGYRSSEHTLGGEDVLLVRCGDQTCSSEALTIISW
jgi:hypothetical protein